MAELVQNIANALSTITILSCMFLKVPQIMHIKQQESADGIYIKALLMEITGFTIMTLYNFVNNYSLLTYLEYPIILLQIHTMTYYVLKYEQLLCQKIVPLGLFAYITIVVLFVAKVLDKEILGYLVPICTPLSGFAKVTYMYGIIQAGNADAVSLTTWLISVATNLARVFTTYVDSADLKLIANFVVSALLSSGVLLTAWCYKLTDNEHARAERRRSANRRKRQ